MDKDRSITQYSFKDVHCRSHKNAKWSFPLYWFEVLLALLFQVVLLFADHLYVSLLCTGPPVCDVVLIPTSTSTTISIMWTVSSCEGALPMSFEIQWNSTDSSDRCTSGHLASAATSHVIEGLRNGTVYDISLTLSDDCGTGSTLIRNVSTLSQG